MTLLPLSALAFGGFSPLHMRGTDALLNGCGHPRAVCAALLSLASTGPLDKKEALASAANAGEGKAVTRWHDVSASHYTRELGGFQA